MALNPTNPVRRQSVSPTGTSFTSLPDTGRLQVVLEAAAAEPNGGGLQSEKGWGGGAEAIVPAALSAELAVPDGTTSVYNVGTVGDNRYIQGNFGGAAVLKVDGQVAVVCGGAGGNGVGDTDTSVSDPEEVVTGAGGAPGGVGGEYFPDLVPFDPNAVDQVETGGDAESPAGVPAVGGDGADVDDEYTDFFESSDGDVAFYRGADGAAAVVDNTLVSETTTATGANVNTTGVGDVQEEPFVAADLDAPRVVTGPAGGSASVPVDIAVRNIGLFERDLDITVSVGEASTTITRTIATDTTHTDTVTLSPTVMAPGDALPVSVAVDGETAETITHVLDSGTTSDAWILSHPDATIALSPSGLSWTPREISLEAVVEETNVSQLRPIRTAAPAGEKGGIRGQFVQAIRDATVLIRPPDTQQPPFSTRDATVQSLSFDERAPNLDTVSATATWVAARPVSGLTAGHGDVSLSVGDATLSLSNEQLGQRTETTEGRVRVDEVPIRIGAPVAAAICEHASHAGGAVIRDRPFADAVAVDATVGDQLSASLSGSPIDSADLVLLGASVEQVAPTPTPRPYRVTLRLARND